MGTSLPGAEPDRRPIAVRQHRWAQHIAAWLVAHRASANAISLWSVVAGGAAGTAFAATAWWPDGARLWWLLGAVMVQLRLLCNLFDGMVATASGRPSAVGELYNEVPDRVSDAATLVGLGYAAGGMPWLGYLAALSAVFTAYIRTMGKATGAGSDFRGPMAKQQRMFLVTAAAVYVALTPREWQPCLGGEHGWRLPALVLAVVVVGSVWTSVRRLRGIAIRLREKPQ